MLFVKLAVNFKKHLYMQCLNCAVLHHFEVNFIVLWPKGWKLFWSFTKSVMKINHSQTLICTITNFTWYVNHFFFFFLRRSVLSVTNLKYNEEQVYHVSDIREMKSIFFFFWKQTRVLYLGEKLFETFYTFNLYWFKTR